MPSRRQERVARVRKESVSDTIANRLSDPRIDGLVSVTEVDVSPDLARATVHVGVIGDEFTPDEVIDALERSEPFLHREMARELRMRRVPRLRFRYDDSAEEADRLTGLMREIATDEGRPLTRPTDGQRPSPRQGA